MKEAWTERRAKPLRHHHAISLGSGGSAVSFRDPQPPEVARREDSMSEERKKRRGLPWNTVSLIDISFFTVAVR
jgi:hypothetical protein